MTLRLRCCEYRVTCFAYGYTEEDSVSAQNMIAPVTAKVGAINREITILNAKYERATNTSRLAHYYPSKLLPLVLKRVASH
jgi:hypothetical protein